MRTFQVGIVILLVTAGFAGMINLTSDSVQGSIVGGTITSDTRWVPENNPYVIVSPINIQHGGSLRIESGVEVIYDGDHQIKVDGALALIGTNASRVKMDSNHPKWEYMDWTGIQVGPTGYVDINYAELSFSGNGITLKSSYNRITNSMITNNKYGYSVKFDASTHNTISGTTMTGLGLGISGNVLEHFNTHTITPDNTVNTKPLLYYKDTDSLSVDAVPVGQLILANCTNSDVRNLQIADSGITAAYTTGSIIYNNEVSTNRYGMQLYKSDNNVIVFNDVYQSYLIGVYLMESDGNMIFNNNFGTSFMGVGLLSSDANIITNNNIQSNMYGVRLYSSMWNILYANNLAGNSMEHAYDDGSFNYWTKAYPGAGNYWADYSQTCQDLFSGPVTPQTSGSPDGICDNPYYIDGNSIDYYPLVNPAFKLPTHMPGNIEQVPPETQSTAHEPVPPATPPVRRTGIELKEGWNTVSYPLGSEETVSEALSGVPYERVELKKEASELTVLLADNDLMKPGQTYLIKVSSATIWIFDD
jgi:parallel beta-helix repeat protein